MYARKYLSLAFLFVFVVAGLAQESGATLTPEMLVQLEFVSGVTMAPDGEHIAYILNKPRALDEKPGPRWTELWVASVEGKLRRFTSSAYRTASDPQWSPDGRRIAFRSKRFDSKEHTQVYVISLDGGEAVRLTDSESSVRLFRWSPDGKWIAYVAAEPKTKEEKEAEKKGRDWTEVDKHYKHLRLWLVDPATKEARRLIEKDVSVWSLEWSPDSRQLVVQASPTPKTDDSYMFKRLYTVSVDDGKLKPLTETEGKLGPMAWSPDGRNIAFLAGVDRSDPSLGGLFVVPAAGGKARNLLAGYEGTPAWVGWLDNQTLAFTAVEATILTFNAIPAAGGEISRILSGNTGFYAVSFSKDRSRFACAASAYNHPNELFWAERKQGRLVRLTDSNPELRNVRFAKQEEIRWSARDGLEITGLLMKPLDYKPGRRYPLIVQVHGGPESAYVDAWTTTYTRWTQLLAARGYVVFMPNYRGSTGRGVAYAKADHKDMAGKEFDDVLDGIDFLIEHGPVDAERVGIGGWSYGGYFSAWGATRHSPRFKAAVMGAGISNWHSFMGTTDIPYEEAYVHWDLWCYDEPELCWDRSPVAHIRNAQTPTLVVHGASDLRVPVGQGWEMYTALKIKGVPTELVIYPREPHGLRETAHQLDVIQRALAWFDRYVKGEEGGTD